jgi:hypothetical protein
MNEILDGIQVSTAAPIEELYAAMSSEENVLSPLELTVLCKRAEKFLGNVRERLLESANSEFAMLQVTNPDKIKWDIANGVGFVQKYSPRAEWEYPAEVEKMAADLVIKRAKAKEDKTAKKISKPVNIITNSSFSINLTEKF